REPFVRPHKKSAAVTCRNNPSHHAGSGCSINRVRTRARSEVSSALHGFTPEILFHFWRISSGCNPIETPVASFGGRGESCSCSCSCSCFGESFRQASVKDWPNDSLKSSRNDLRL